MKHAAICIIGSELVRGIIQDKHGQIIAADLTRLGYEVQEITIVPDNGAIAEVLKRLVASVDLIITTGGLGPTSDDITRDAIASSYDLQLIVDEDAKDVLISIVGDHMNEANLRQVMIPEGFRVVPNAVGTAPGFCRDGEIYALPGPPHEMVTMWKDQVLPDLARFLGGKRPEERLELSVFLIPESQLEEVCVFAVTRVAGELHLAEEQIPAWGTRVQPYRISLHLQGGTDTIRRAVYKQLRAEIGPYLIREGDLEAVDLLYIQLEKRSAMIAGAESCTGGLVGKLLTDRPGSSQFVWGSLMTYANEAKERILHVDHQILETEGAVSRACAAQMAEGILQHSGADVAFSISGIAGPAGGSVKKPVGLVWFGFASPGRLSEQVQLSFRPFSRDSIRRRAAVSAILLLEQYLMGKKLLDIVKKWQYI